MGEMIEQCIEEQSENNPIKFTRERVRMREQIEYDKDEGSFGFVKECFAEQKRANWIILIDAGDFRVIEKKINEIKSQKQENKSMPEYESIIDCQTFLVEHTMEIPVGIGFHPDCALWCADSTRSKKISQLALSFLKNEQFVIELRNMGIEPFDTSPESNISDIKTEQRPELKMKASSN